MADTSESIPVDALLILQDLNINSYFEKALQKVDIRAVRENDSGNVTKIINLHNNLNPKLTFLGEYYFKGESTKKDESKVVLDTAAYYLKKKVYPRIVVVRKKEQSIIEYPPAVEALMTNIGKTKPELKDKRFGTLTIGDDYAQQATIDILVRTKLEPILYDLGANIGRFPAPAPAVQEKPPEPEPKAEEGNNLKIKYLPDTQTLKLTGIIGKDFAKLINDELNKIEKKDKMTVDWTEVESIDPTKEEEVVSLYNLLSAMQKKEGVKITQKGLLAKGGIFPSQNSYKLHQRGFPNID